MIVNENYVEGYPSTEAAASLFAGGWTSHLPLVGVDSGRIPLFADDRIDWCLAKLGSIRGMEVLELGPLEGGHTYMLHNAGAARITAIEANSLSYMKCLVVKEIFLLDRARFLLGDFSAYLDQGRQSFDLIVASGVLYHLIDPLPVLSNMTRRARRIFIWSHFFDEAAMPPGDPRREPFTGRVVEREIDGFKAKYHYRGYGGKISAKEFCGGIYTESVWLELNDLRELLEKAGFAVETAFEQPDAAHGPAACLLATRS